jgi:diacylglycerol O-acyltransferase
MTTPETPLAAELEETAHGSHSPPVAMPGSPSALYTVGRHLVASYPHVPTGYELGLGVAVQSYDGKLFFGVTADVHVAPDVARLRDDIRRCFEQLYSAAVPKTAAAGAEAG